MGKEQSEYKKFGIGGWLCKFDSLNEFSIKTIKEIHLDMTVEFFFNIVTVPQRIPVSYNVFNIFGNTNLMISAVNSDVTATEGIVTVTPRGAAPVTNVSLISYFTWHHLAIVRHGIYNFDIYIDGINVYSFTSTSSNAENQLAPILYWAGELNPDGSGHAGIAFDEIRVTGDVARYMGNFTPPTQAFPRQGP
jgi:hypothetical protein